MDSVPAFRVKLGANDLNCVDVPLNPTHSLTQRVREADQFLQPTVAKQTDSKGLISLMNLALAHPHHPGVPDLVSVRILVNALVHTLKLYSFVNSCHLCFLLRKSNLLQVQE